MAAPSAPSAPDSAAAPAASDLVRIYNRSPKIYVDHRPDPAAPGQFIDFRALPNAYATIPRSLAEYWLKSFPDHLIAGDDALKSIDASAAAAQAVLAENEDLKKAKADLEAQLAEMQARLNAAGGGPAGS